MVQLSTVDDPLTELLCNVEPAYKVMVLIVDGEYICSFEFEFEYRSVALVAEEEPLTVMTEL